MSARQAAGAGRGRRDREVESRTVILAGDVGGTNTRLALFEPDPGRPKLIHMEQFSSGDHGGLDEIVTVFLERHAPKLGAAAFGVAGPVVDGRSRAMNLAWSVDARDLSRLTGLGSVGLMNDLVANAWGISALVPESTLVLNAGRETPGACAAVISPGTGLGVAGLFWDGERHRPFPTETGHAGFAPTDDVEVDLYKWLRERHGHSHVFCEHAVSGPGIVSIYEFLRDTGREEEPQWLAEAMRTGDRGVTITQVALEGLRAAPRGSARAPAEPQRRAAICEVALDRFVRLLGAEAANTALRLLALGGIWIGGGIAPRIVEKLTDGAFLEAFTANPKLGDLLAGIPVRVILDDRTALIGAAICAMEG